MMKTKKNTKKVIGENEGRKLLIKNIPMIPLMKRGTDGGNSIKNKEEDFKEYQKNAKKRKQDELRLAEEESKKAT